MDTELAELSTAAATALVQSLTTDGWRATRDAVVSLWRRMPPEQADAVDADLTQHRGLLIAGEDGTASRLTAEWTGRLHGLAAADPGVIPALRQLTGPGTITVKARVSGHGRVIVAGRDAYIDG